MAVSQGTVCWIIGMSASGKTTLAKELYKLLQNRSKSWIYLDGDAVRNVFGEDLGHTIEDRKRNADRISLLCKGLAANGYNVLACVLSIFPENQKENRKTMRNYKEVYIRVGLKKLMQRDNKNLYQAALDGNIKNVVGVDIAFPEPYAPDIVIENDVDNIDFTALAIEVLHRLGLDYDRDYPYTRVNMLQKPFKYEYTPYEGPVLLDSYRESRNRLLKLWECNMAKARFYMPESGPFVKSENILSLGLSDLFGHIRKECEAEIDETDLLITRSLFFGILERQCQNIHADDDALIIEKFIKKFEVYKRIFTRYYPDTLTKASTEFSDIFVYLLFSNILARYAFNQTGEGKKAIAFNALIKLNDTIASVSEQIYTPAETCLAYYGLKGETEIFSRYGKRDIQ